MEKPIQGKTKGIVGSCAGCEIRVAAYDSTEVATIVEGKSTVVNAGT